MATRTKRPSLDAQQFAIEAARIAHGDHAEDVLVLDLRELTSIADFFVICTGTSDRQMRAIVDHIDEFAEKIGEKRYGISGLEASAWILADYIDVVVHVFDAEHREFYDLELLWGDAPRVSWEDSQAES